MTDFTWTDLFDTFQMEMVCDLVREDVETQAIAASQPRMHVALRKILRTNLDAYISENGGIRESGDLRMERIDIAAAFALFLFAGDLAERIETRGATDDDAGELRRLWMEFIAFGSAHRIYDDKPKERAARVKGGKSTGAKARAWIGDAVSRFDPGPETGGKAHRARIIRRQAIKAGFRDAKKLPKRLDKYLR